MRCERRGEGARFFPVRASCTFANLDDSVLRVTSSLCEGDRETLYTGKKLTNALRTTRADLFETSSEKVTPKKS